LIHAPHRGGDPPDGFLADLMKAATLRRDNLRRSADELRVHFAKAKKALIEPGEANLDA
jgi:hypothetical protein